MPAFVHRCLAPERELDIARAFLTMYVEESPMHVAQPKVIRAPAVRGKIHRRNFQTAITHFKFNIATEVVWGFGTIAHR